MQAFFCTVSHRVGGTLRPVGRWLLASMTLSGYLLRALRAWAKGRCPSAHPALAAGRLGGQGGGLRPSSCPHSHRLGRSGRVKGSPRLARVLAALRAAPASRGRFAPLTRPPPIPPESPETGLQRVFLPHPCRMYHQGQKTPLRAVLACWRLFGCPAVERRGRVKGETGSRSGAQGRSPEHRTGEDFGAKREPLTLNRSGHAPGRGEGKKGRRPVCPAPLTTEGDSFPPEGGGGGRRKAKPRRP